MLPLFSSFLSAVLLMFLYCGHDSHLNHQASKFFFNTSKVWMRVWKIALPLANSLMNWMKNCNRVGARLNGIYNEWMNRLLMLETAILYIKRLSTVSLLNWITPTHTVFHCAYTVFFHFSYKSGTNERFTVMFYWWPCSSVYVMRCNACFFLFMRAHIHETVLHISQNKTVD